MDLTVTGSDYGTVTFLNMPISYLGVGVKTTLWSKPLAMGA